MKKAKTVIGIIIAVVLIVLLANPQWYMNGTWTEKMLKSLVREHFLIQNSGQFTLAHLAGLVLVLCVVWLCYTVIKLILQAIGRKGGRTAAVTTLIIGILKYLAVIVAVIWGLSILGVNTTAVLAGVGIVGLILGFGAQSLIEDIITGAFIIFEGQYAVGDVIVLDDFRGVVRSIGVRTTTIEDAGGNLKVVNNSDIRNFQNRSRIDSLAICEVGVTYGADLKQIEKTLVQALPALYETSNGLYLEAPRYTGVSELGDNGVILRFAVPVKEENIFIATRKLNRDIRVLFAEKGIEIPFPQVVVHQGE